MKKILIIFGVMFAVIATSCSSCNGPQGGTSTPEKDTIAQPVDSLNEVTGVAVSGAMNSIDLVVGNDTVSFSYPELDPEKRDSWQEGDSVQIRYVKTQDGDSVTEVNNISEVA